MTRFDQHFSQILQSLGFYQVSPPVKEQLMHILTLVVVGRKHIWLETSAEMKVDVFSTQDGPVGCHVGVKTPWQNEGPWPHPS